MVKKKTQQHHRPSALISFLNQDLVFVVLFELGLLLFSLYLVTPILTFGFEYALITSNLSYVSLSTLPLFMFNPLTWMTLGLVFAILSVVLLFHDFFINLDLRQLNQMPIPKIKLLILAFQNVILFLKKRKLSMLVSVWLQWISYNIPFIILTIRTHPYIRYVMSETSITFIWMLMLILVGWIVVHTNEYKLKAVMMHVRFNLILGFIFSFIYVVMLLMMVVLVAFILPSEVAVAALMSLLDRFNGLFALMLIVMSTLSHHVFRFNQTILEPAHVLTPTKKVEILTIKHRKSWISLLVALLLVDGLLFINILSHGTRLQTMSVDQIQVTSHRGYSFDHPENTLIAIQKAIDSFADVVEVDVRVTQDGEFVLLHDDNLSRTTGINQSISVTSFETATSLDAGSWLSPDFLGETLPSLRSALELSKGRVPLNLDLKLGVRQLDVIEDLVTLIDEYEMQYQVIMTSTCLACLERIKEFNPNIQTGLITYRLTPALLSNPAINAFSMKSTFVTLNTVTEITSSNKQIMVWTVNTRSEIERMSRLGVHNIITSRPTYVKEVLFELSGNQLLIQLLRLIID